MAAFLSPVITDAGQALFARAISGDTQVTFTKIMSGDGTYESTEDLTNVTQLKSPKQTFPINARRADGDTVLLKYVLSNINPDGTYLQEGYYVRELAVYAVSGDEGASEILAAIVLATEDEADYMPAYNNIAPSRYTLGWYIALSNSSDVAVHMDDDTYALADDVQENLLKAVHLPPYRAGDTYTQDDLVVHDGYVWICTAATAQGITPAEGGTWGLFWDGQEAVESLKETIGGYDVIEPGMAALHSHDEGQYFITAHWGYVRAMTNIAVGDEFELGSTVLAMEGNIEQETISNVLVELNELIREKAQINHASAQPTYGLGSSSMYGHVKTQSGDLKSQTETSGVAASNAHTHSQYLTSHQDISGKAPNNHASSATTYGVGTTANYGHVKIQPGDMNGQTAADGIAAARSHYHSQYLTAHQDISGKAPNNHASAATTYGIATTANYGHVKIQSGNMYGTANTNGIAAGLGHTHSQYLTAHQDISGKAPNNHAVNAATYGLGTASVYGHVKLSDVYASSVGAAANAIGASQYALYSAYAALLNLTPKYAADAAALKTVATNANCVIPIQLSASLANTLVGVSGVTYGIARINSGIIHMLLFIPGAAVNRKLTSVSYNTSNGAITNRVYYGATAF